MTDKRKALEPVLEKVGKLFAMLGSDNRDEVATAAAKIKENLSKVGLDLHDLWQFMVTEKKEELSAAFAALFIGDVELLLKIGKERASFFSNDAVLADVMVRGHRSTYPVESREFANWLRFEFYNENQRAPAVSSIKSAVRTLAAIAEFGPETPRHRVHLRAAEEDGRIYIDLCNDRWQCVEVDENGWRVVDAPPSVRFRRTPGMRALPVPVPGGSVDLLKKFVNLTDGDFVLFVCVMLDAFRSGKHPVLNLVGEFATAKSTLAKMFKRLVDPDKTELRSLPGTLRDMFIAVNSARVRAWDNISKIERAISDALCELSDGSGFGTRKLYSDDDEFTVQGSRSIILNGLSNCATRPDLASRTVMLQLQPIRDGARKSETELWAEFDQACPSILGALLDILAGGLKKLPSVRLERKSRMADFELFGTACAGEAFTIAFAANAAELNEAIIEGDPVAKAIITFMDQRTEWSNTTTALMSELTNRDGTEQQVSKQRDWPRDATRFGRRVRDVSASLRKAGIEVSHARAPGPNKTRMINLRKTGDTKDTKDTGDTETKSSQQHKAEPSKAAKKRDIVPSVPGVPSVPVKS
jgi:hypothetical protein